MGEMSFFMTGCKSVTILTSPRDAVNRTADTVTFVSCVNFVAMENFSVLEPSKCKTINKQNQMAVKLEANTPMLELND
jgi:hypothetical protein